MKKVFFYTMAFAFASLLYSCSSRPADGTYQFEVYSQNDVHGKFFDSLYVGNLVNKSSMANVSAFIKERRAAVGEENVMLFDAGDHLQGDNAAYYYNYIHEYAPGEKLLFTRLAEYMDFDVLVLGNHDVEAGHPVYDRLKSELGERYLAANAVDEKTREPYFAPYRVFTKNGVKVAVIGMTNPANKKWLGENLWKGLDFLPIKDLAQRYIDEIKAKEDPQLMFLVIHSGLGDVKVDDIENSALYLATALKGVDVIFASHDHKTYCNKLWNGTDSVLVVEAGARGRALSGIDIKMTVADGKVVSKDIQGRIIEMAPVAKDEDYLKTFRQEYLNVKAFTNRKVGSLDRDMYTREGFFGTSDYTDLLHYVQLKATGAQISFAAPLTFNGVVKAGDLTFNDLFTIYPFENQLYKVKLTGKQIKNYLEESYRTWVNTVSKQSDHLLNIAYNEKYGKYSFQGATYNYDAAAGIVYEVDVRQPFGERINILSMKDGSPFDMEAEYTIAMTSYRANGGGDLLVNGAGLERSQLPGIILDKYPEIRNMIYDYFSTAKGDEYKGTATWKFVPEYLAGKALERDIALMF